MELKNDQLGPTSFHLHYIPIQINRNFYLISSNFVPIHDLALAFIAEWTFLQLSVFYEIDLNQVLNH